MVVSRGRPPFASESSHDFEKSPDRTPLARTARVAVDEHAWSVMIGEHRFTQLARDHAGAVTAYARAVAPDRWTADDAVQETFLRAWKYRDSFRATGSFEGWLIRICHNCLADFAAKRTASPTAELPDRAEPPDELSDLYDLVARLPVDQREIVAICGLLGYDYAGAAELLDVPIGTVRSRLHRARAAIAKQLDGSNQEASA
jgi:RNA polymerase sigma-70 factor (ECF subfamily)